MKLRHLCIAALTSILVLGSHVSADITVSTSEPTTDVLLDRLNGASVGAMIDATAGPGARGATFSLGGPGAFSIDGLTIQANNAATFTAGQNFTVAVFSGTPSATFTAPGAGNINPATLAANTGLTLLGADTLDATVAGSVASNNFLTFDLTAQKVSGSDQLFAFVFTDFAFSHREGTNNIFAPNTVDGGRLQFAAGTTNFGTGGPGGIGSGSRDFRFLIHGQAIPEPTSAALFGLGAIGLIARRRRS